MQSALQAVDTPCQTTSRACYTNLRHSKELQGVEPSFSDYGRSLPWSDKKSYPLFRGVRAHLNKMNMSLRISFDTSVLLSSQRVRDTLVPLASQHQTLLRVR
jgi:hypothetical protein